MTSARKPVKIGYKVDGAWKELLYVNKLVLPGFNNSKYHLEANQVCFRRVSVSCFCISLCSWRYVNPYIPDRCYVPVLVLYELRVVETSNDTARSNRTNCICQAFQKFQMRLRVEISSTYRTHTHARWEWSCWFEALRWDGCHTKYVLVARSMTELA